MPERAAAVHERCSARLDLVHEQNHSLPPVMLGRLGGLRNSRTVIVLVYVIQA
jgi:hypothetical protein